MPFHDVTIRSDDAPAVAVTGFFVAWPQAQRWNQSDARVFSTENSGAVLRHMTRDGWNACGQPLPRSCDDAVRNALTCAADEAARVLASRSTDFDATRCAIVFSSSKGELDLLPLWAANGRDNSEQLDIIATFVTSVKTPYENASFPSSQNASAHNACQNPVSNAIIQTGFRQEIENAFSSDANFAGANKTCEKPASIATLVTAANDDFLPWAPDAPARVLARHLKSRGAVLSPVAACAGGAHSIAIGAQLIEDGRADFVVCGALEAGLSPLMMAGYKSLGALSPGGAMRPFDAARDGFVPREGLALLVLENAKIARKRGARVLARVSGSAMNADATAMTTMQPDGRSIARAIEVALGKANTRVKLPIDFVNAHATATRLNDALESRAIAEALGESTAVGATKSATGHWLGAAGALEAVLCVLSIREGFLPPCIGFSRRGDDIAPLDFIVGSGRETSTRRALSLSYGFGGHIGALVFDAP